MRAIPTSNFRKSPAAIFPAWSARSATAPISRWATRCSACSAPARKAPIARRSRSRQRSSPRSPNGLSHINAAALALTGLTAINSVEDTLKLQRGETILIQGGAGGVAGFAIQFAKYLGAKVITTCSAANVDYVRGLGADQVIDYNAENFTRVVSGCDAVFDTVGGDVAKQSYAVLKPGGRAAFIASGAEAPKPDRSDVTALRPPVPRSRKAMERIAEVYVAGGVKPPEVKLYKLSQAADAHRLSQSRHFRGKLVFQVR